MKFSCFFWAALIVAEVPSVFPSQIIQQNAKKEQKRDTRKINRKPGTILPTIIAETPTINAPPTCDNPNAEEQQQPPIPKLIIQTVKTKQDKMTQNGPNWFQYHASLMDQNPDYAFLVFDDDEALDFIDQHFQGTALPDVMRRVPRPVMKADLFRLAAVSVLGGFYMDMDMFARDSFDPIVRSGCGAVFPKEWWKGDDAFVERHFALPTDDEEHWQVGNYAFAAVPNHPLVADSLEEAVKRTIEVIHKKENDDYDVTDLDVLRTTGPYMLSEVYHAGRKDGKYKDVLHIQGDKSKPLKKNQENRFDWHKFGPYAEHMLSHTWVQDEEELKSVSG